MLFPLPTTPSPSLLWNGPCFFSCWSGRNGRACPPLLLRKQPFPPFIACFSADCGALCIAGLPNGRVPSIFFSPSSRGRLPSALAGAIFLLPVVVVSPLSPPPTSGATRFGVILSFPHPARTAISPRTAFSGGSSEKTDGFPSCTRTSAAHLYRGSGAILVRGFFFLPFFFRWPDSSPSSPIVS